MKHPRGGDPFITPLESPFYYDSVSSNSEALEKAMQEGANTGYPRYWHGYLVLLKPLLILFDIKEIRLLFQTAFFISLAVLIGLWSCWHGRKGIAASVALVASIILLGGADATATLPIFFSFIIAVLSMIAVTVLMKKSSKAELAQNLISIFLITGACTVYFDFFDNPILTLCFPLSAIVVFSTDRFSMRKMLKLLVICSLVWAVGYGCVWFAKWALATAFTDRNVIQEAVSQAAFRTGIDESAQEYGSSPLLAIAENLQVLGFVKWLLFVAFAIAAIALVIEACKAFRAPQAKPVLVKMLFLGAISLIPFLWFLVVSNHSYIHAGIISYRNMVVSFYCLLMIPAFLGNTIGGVHVQPHESVRELANREDDNEDFSRIEAK